MLVLVRIFSMIWWVCNVGWLFYMVGFLFDMQVGYVLWKLCVLILLIGCFLIMYIVVVQMCVWFESVLLMFCLFLFYVCVVCVICLCSCGMFVVSVVVFSVVIRVSSSSCFQLNWCMLLQVSIIIKVIYEVCEFVSSSMYFSVVVVSNYFVLLKCCVIGSSRNGDRLVSIWLNFRLQGLSVLLRWLVSVVLLVGYNVWLFMVSFRCFSDQNYGLVLVSVCISVFSVYVLVISVRLLKVRCCCFGVVIVIVISYMKGRQCSLVVVLVYEVEGLIVLMVENVCGSQQLRNRIEVSVYVVVFNRCGWCCSWCIIMCVVVQSVLRFSMVLVMFGSGYIVMYVSIYQGVQCLVWLLCMMVVGLVGEIGIEVEGIVLYGLQGKWDVGWQGWWLCQQGQCMFIQCVCVVEWYCIVGLQLLQQFVDVIMVLIQYWVVD